MQILVSSGESRQGYERGGGGAITVPLHGILYIVRPPAKTIVVLPRTSYRRRPSPESKTPQGTLLERGRASLFFRITRGAKGPCSFPMLICFAFLLRWRPISLFLSLSRVGVVIGTDGARQGCGGGNHVKCFAVYISLRRGNGKYHDVERCSWHAIIFPHFQWWQLSTRGGRVLPMGICLVFCFFLFWCFLAVAWLLLCTHGTPMSLLPPGGLFSTEPELSLANGREQRAPAASPAVNRDSVRASE